MSCCVGGTAAYCFNLYVFKILMLPPMLNTSLFIYIIYGKLLLSSQYPSVAIYMSHIRYKENMYEEIATPLYIYISIPTHTQNM